MKTQTIQDAISNVFDYLRARDIHIYHFGGRCFFNLSSCHVTGRTLASRKLLESAGVITRHTKSELEKDGIYIQRGFHGGYCLWESDTSVVNDYVARLVR